MEKKVKLLTSKSECISFSRNDESVTIELDIKIEPFWTYTFIREMGIRGTNTTSNPEKLRIFVSHISDELLEEWIDEILRDIEG